MAVPFSHHLPFGQLIKNLCFSLIDCGNSDELLWIFLLLSKEEIIKGQEDKLYKPSN